MPRSRLIFSIILCSSLLACSGIPEGTQETVEQPPFDQAEGEIVALAERQSEADAAASSPPVGGQEELRPEPAAVESAPSPEPELVILPAGTVLEVRLAEPISSTTNKAGDELIAILDRDLKVDGKVVFPQGTKAYGKLLAAKGSGRLEGRPETTITLTELRPREEAYRVKTENITIQAEGTQQPDATVIGGAAGVGLSAAKREPLSVQRLGVEPVRPPS